MGKTNNILAHFKDQTSLNPESFPWQPIIEIAGESRVLIENHLGVAAYGKENIIVNVKYGSIRVCGCNMEMIHMTKHQLVIMGKINSVGLHRRR